MTAPPLIDSPEALSAIAAHLRTCDWFALDTEFIREDTYWPRLCLVQVATDERLACIDPLALDTLEPLLEVLYDPGVIKVLHAAGQDLEIFHHLDGRVPAPVFDTQVAAPLLGFPEQAGFATLVETLLGVRLAKGHARTDWNERPLPAAALSYAADDVRYLVPLYREIRDALAARGRLGWLDAELARLTDASRYERPPEDAWRRLKGIERLPGPGRAVAQALAAWREGEARVRDLPRGRVLRDDALLEVARTLPRDRDQLRRMRALRGAALERHGDTLLRLVAEARAQPAPEIERGARAAAPLDARDEALVDALSALVRLRAAENELNPATVAGRRELARIATGERAADVLAGWRAALLGDELDAMMSGGVALRVGVAGLEAAGSPHGTA